MDTSLAHENARLRALLQTQQDTIRQMAEYNRLLSQRVAAYASEINRLKALVAKLQRMQFGKSSEQLRAKTERQIQEAQERISALQEEMAETTLFRPPLGFIVPSAMVNIWLSPPYMSKGLCCFSYRSCLFLHPHNSSDLMST